MTAQDQRSGVGSDKEIGLIGKILGQKPTTTTSSSDGIIEKNGKFIYTNADGKAASAKTREDAEIQIAKIKVDNGSKPIIVGDRLIFKDGGDVKNISKTEYELKIGDKKFSADKDRLTRAKDDQGLYQMYDARNKELQSKLSKLNPETQMDIILGIQNNIDDNLYSMWKIQQGDGPGGSSGGGGRKQSFMTAKDYGRSYSTYLSGLTPDSGKVSLKFKGLEAGGKSAAPRKRLGRL